MKISSLSRIYVDRKLSKDILLNLEDVHYHYLKTVLRLKVNDKVRIFNGSDGEFIGKITDITRNNISVLLMDLFRTIAKEPNLTLALAVIKNDKMLDAISMAVQLGVTVIAPLNTERSQFHKINTDKIKRCIIEFTEQSERLVPPTLLPLSLLNNFLEQTSHNFILYANENEDPNKTLLTVYSNVLENWNVNREVSERSVVTICEHANPHMFCETNLEEQKSITLIIGPEVGFSENELNMFAQQSNCYSFSLGPNVLRTETAVAASLAQAALLR